MKHYGAVDDPKDITTKEYVDAADNALKVKVDALWDFVCTDITSNPFQITFEDLGGLTVRSGMLWATVHTFAACACLWVWCLSSVMPSCAGVMSPISSCPLILGLLRRAS